MMQAGERREWSQSCLRGWVELTGVLFLSIVLLAGVAVAQQATGDASPASHPAPATSGKDAAAGSRSTFGSELREASREAEGEGRGEGNDDLKFSPAVRWVSQRLGISIEAGYWLAFVLNFAVLATLIYLIARSRAPQVFRSRTGQIRKELEEAAKASAEANRRLAEIQARLARLDTEIEAMRRQAEEEAAKEEEKLRLAAAEDARRIVQAAEQEIAAAIKLARHELTAYAAALAVSLAEKRINVDEETDEALVRSFAQELGNGTSSDHNGSGKDGQ